MAKRKRRATEGSEAARIRPRRLSAGATLDQTKLPAASGGRRPANMRRALVLAAMTLLVIATGVAYLPAMRGGLIWDDDAHVTRPELRSWEGLYRIWFDLGATQQYYPL